MDESCIQSSFFGNEFFLLIIFLSLFLVPSFYFGEPEYKVDENTPFIEVTVFRTGTDVSKMASITVRSRASNPVSAIGKYLPTQKRNMEDGECFIMVSFHDDDDVS